jgi:hypothetical protein
MSKSHEPRRGNPEALFAIREDLSTWSTSAKRARHDYDSQHHTLDGMMTTHYWSTVMDLIEAGDIVHIVDSTGAQAEIRIDWKLDGQMQVGVSKMREIEESPVLNAQGFTIKFRGNNGGYWCVINDQGAIIERDYREKADALKALDLHTNAAKSKVAA